MKRTSIAFLTIAAASALALTQTPILLRHSFKADQKDEYKVEMTVKQMIAIPSMGDQEMGMKGGMKYALAYGAPDATTGKAALKLTVTDIKVELEGAMADAGGMADQIPKEMKLDAKVDSRNRMTDFKAEGNNMAMMMMSGANSALSNFFIEFPEKEVAIGDTWDVKMEKNAMTGGQEAVLKAKLVGEKEVDGKKLWVLTMDGKIPMKMDMAEAMKGQTDPTGGMMADMVITGSIEMNSEALVDPSNGKTISVVSKMKTKQQMEMKAMGMNLDMSGDITMKVTLAK